MYSELDEHKFDVIIVGAGLSGLTAAYHILKKESTLSVTIFEAKDRMGGRILTKDIKLDDNQTVRCDLGGQYFSKNQTLIINLLNELDINYEESKRSTGLVMAVFRNRIKKSSSRPPIFCNFILNYELEHFFSELEELSEKIQMHVPYDESINETFDSISMEEYINKKLYFFDNKRYVKILIKTYFGVDASDISVLYYCAYCNSNSGIIDETYVPTNAGKCWIKDGASTICDQLANAIGERNIHLNVLVKKVKHFDRFVIVKTNVGYYKCGLLIVTIPPNELLNVEFEPDLPIKSLDYLCRMKHGKAIKFIAIYRNAFWSWRNLSGDIFIREPNGPVLTCFSAKIDEYPALWGFINPKFQRRNISSYELYVLNELSKYIGQLALQPLAYVEKDWREELYTGGCPTSVPGIDTLNDSISVVEPFERIHWAGSETSTYCYGHMAGAIYSGYRAAFQVLYRIRPQSLNLHDMKYVQPGSIWFTYYEKPGVNKYINLRCLVPSALLSLMLVLYIKKKLKSN